MTGSVFTSYNAEQTTVTDQAGKKRRSIVDGLGRLKQVDELNEDGSLYASTGYIYDALGNLLQVDQGTQHRFYTYDSLSRLLTAKNPEQVNASSHMVETTYDYDDASNLTTKTGPNSGGSLSFTYDGLNRIKTKTLSSGGIWNYAYDSATISNAKGRLVSVVLSGGTDGYYYDGYDAMGRVTSSRQVTTAGVANSYTLSYGYDLAGNLTTQTYPSGKEYRTSYDNAGRVSDVKRFLSSAFDKTYASQFGYSAHGAVASVTLGNNLVETTAFNSRLQPTSITLGTLASFGYTYGVLNGGTLDTTKNNGNVQSQTVTIAPYSIKQSYSYDPLNRLSQVEEALNTNSRWTQSYGYDRWGNRTSLSNTGTDGGLLPTQTTPAIDSSTNRLSGLGYDNAGNLTTNGLGQQLLYDAENRMTNFNGGVGQYSYDGDGRRVKKIDGSGTTVFVYNAAGQLIAEYHSDPVPATPGGGGTSYLTTDHLGSTRVVTRSDGTVRARYDYLPFGEELVGPIGGRTAGWGYGASDGTRQKFTQKERDSESGLDYFLARYYSSAQGRFTGPDPILSSAIPGNPQTWNRYSYCLNNPLNVVDPSGMWNWSSALGGDLTDDQLRWRVDQIQNNADLTDEQRTAQTCEINNILIQRQAFRDALDLAKLVVDRADITPSEAAAARLSLGEYGKENDGNGVLVAIRANENSPAFTREEGAKTIVAIAPSQFSDPGFWSTILHEGVHIFQSQVRGFFGNPSVATAEFNAYHAEASVIRGIDSAFVRAGRAAEGPRSFTARGTVLWQRGWTEVDMKNGIEQHLRNLGYLDATSKETPRGGTSAFPGGGAGQWR